jgi:hypothetical protein
VFKAQCKKQEKRPEREPVTRDIDVIRHVTRAKSLAGNSARLIQALGNRVSKLVFLASSEMKNPVKGVTTKPRNLMTWLICNWHLSWERTNSARVKSWRTWDWTAVNSAAELQMRGYRGSHGCHACASE